MMINFIKVDVEIKLIIYDSHFFVWDSAQEKKNLTASQEQLPKFLHNLNDSEELNSY